MKSVKQLVKELGLSITDEQAEQLDKGILENYATRAELEEKKARIATLTEQVGSLAEKVEGGKEAAQTVEALKAELEELRKAEDERKADEAAKAARKAFEGDFTAALGEREFANSLTRDGIFEKAYGIHAANPDMAVADILESCTKDQDGIWKNKQSQGVSPAVPSDNDSQAALLEFTQKLFSK